MRDRLSITGITGHAVENVGASVIVGQLLQMEPEGGDFVVLRTTPERARAIKANLLTQLMDQGAQEHPPGRCPGRLFHGPGHQSATPCQLPAGHEGPHSCIYGEERREAVWMTGALAAEYRRWVGGRPSWLREEDAMTDEHDRAPEAP